MSIAKEYDIALSFAGEDREYVKQVADLLLQSGVKVFYDSFEEEKLWGKDLYVYLSEIYKDKALYTIMFISEHYALKLWTNHERRSMQARAFQESAEYILPAKFDDTEIPGLLPTIGFISLVNRSPQNFVEIINRKLINSGRTIPSESIRKAYFSVSPFLK
ncbi:toll/interleukin-1 receptor domain-containing protein [Yersinia enterocolitica]